MKFEHVQVFLRVVEAGSFSGAAALLDMPLTSVSRQVKALEEGLGVQLLYRTTRKVRSTDAGREFYARCLQAEQMLADARASVASLRTEAEGTLRVLVPYALGLLVLEPTLAAFRASHPRVQLVLTYHNEALDLVEHGYDIAIRIGPLPDTTYAARQLGLSRAVLVASPAYLERTGRPADPRDLRRHDLLSSGGDAPLAQWRLRHIGSGEISDLTLRPVLVANESATLIRQALNGAGIVLASQMLVGRHLASGALESVLPGWTRWPDVELHALFPQRATQERKVRVFLDYLVDVFASWNVAGIASTAG
ncbi:MULTISPECIES: LysR family transcriptional regulator [unclassified Achromobacter]|uniref:LysR family transcriptional regulator n=1 Tax=unclassified Achromobacter TaxID=2626865 RepID=UPI000B516434|nr:MULTISPECIES: LysR family transcriptional regulator [unclassified Achromobacter]OWT73425.1 LysR family transcriptional regulator [Achromobacter sp. HZ34]OWT79657.1 LysR family transcriptional regulator [Achromobacter sp. HZ28]